MFYDNFNDIFRSKGTTITGVLKAIGKSTGSTGTWREGKFPKLDTVMEMAEYLGVSLDELVYGETHKNELSDSDREWLDIIAHIPEEKQKMCKDFLRFVYFVDYTMQTYFCIARFYVAGMSVGCAAPGSASL